MRRRMRESEQGAGLEIGAEIARARHAAGLSHADLAERTRIRVGIIEAIEREDFDACGGIVYARGHVRAIAAALGVDGGAWLDGLGGADAATNLAQAEPDRLNIWELRERSIAVTDRRSWTLLVVGAVVVIAALVYFSRQTPTSDELVPTPEPSAAATSDAVASPTPKSTPVTGAVQFTITCTSSSWVRITNALGTVYEGTMRPGETQDIASDSDVQMRVGNAAGIQLDYNGRFYPNLGNPGEVYSHTFPVL